jgi:hypothetical protein
MEQGKNIESTLNIWNKERILKASREKQQVTYKGKNIRIKRGHEMMYFKP